MVSRQEASKFLSNELKFKNWEDVIEEDKLKFLKLLVWHYGHNNYMQNISLSNVAVEERKFPDEKDIIKAGLNGVGGNCITQNGFTMLLLNSLGFDSFLVSGEFVGQNYPPHNHAICIVRLNAEELYLIDNGQTLPFEEPVPLHKLPYVARAVGYRYSYRQAENGIYERTQLDGALFGGDYEDKDTEFVRYQFTLEPRTIEFFRKPLTHFFVDPAQSYFLQHPFLFRYFNENEQGDVIDVPEVSGNRKFIHIRGVSLLIGDDNSKTVKHMSTYDDLKETILKYFPKFSETAVDNALECWNENSKDECFKVASNKIFY